MHIGTHLRCLVSLKLECNILIPYEGKVYIKVVELKEIYNSIVMTFSCLKGNPSSIYWLCELIYVIMSRDRGNDGEIERTVLHPPNLVLKA